ncbi:MAG: phosphatidate cytidylyltransferase [Alistipes sp.]|jgi:phosphatidate cytidylyltransferase|nr:phosphatidate cytidylyltransferase [Alistipes sp.]
MKNLIVRGLSGLVLLAVVVGATLWSKWSFGALLLIIMIGCVVEFYKLCRARGYAPMIGIGLASSVALFGLGFAVFICMGSGVTLEIGTLVTGGLLFLLLIIPTVLVSELWHRSETPIANVATTFAALLYVALPMTLLLFIPQLLSGKWEATTVLCYIALIWVNDVFAYLVGVAIGRHRMCERISPKKSWEGFFGGVIAAIGAGLLCGHLLGGDLLVWGGLAAVVAITGVAGDFVESMFKRSAQVKDSGAIMPGHGGFLDRFDALILSIPYAVAYLLLTL